MRVIGIGGAGGKLAVKMDANAVLVNVSEIEREKVSGGSEHIVAPLLSVDGQFRGSRKNPGIGHDAYNTIQRRLTEIVGGSMLFSSTGGGTGNGITTGIIEDIIARDQLQGSQGLPIQEKTFFCLLLPCCNMEAGEYVTNTIDFISGPLAKAIDHGCTGNVVLFSNELKFNEKIGEDAYNQMIVDSLNVFMSIPDKNQRYKLLENHIDHEDFAAYVAKPYFNHFCYFDFDPSKSFASQLEANSNRLLLPSFDPIEALFFLEVPTGQDHTIFYDILPYFTKKNVTPSYSVVENPSLQRPFITVSRLFSRKPSELIDVFNARKKELTDAKAQKSLEQYEDIQALHVDMVDEAKSIIGNKGDKGAEILESLKRLGKL